MLNEPRQFAVDTDSSISSSEAAQLITTWASDMCTFIKSQDSNHMVAVGDEGFYEASGSDSFIYTIGNGVDHNALTALDCIDFATPISMTSNGVLPATRSL
uniref:CAZy families GH5 protein n=1 Tax=uncultured Bacillus sp. TaxID=83428 RepID=A0A060CE56_9BACI|nr:CAZy families GH5 protein [uncultured Bacillus sp.]